MANDLSNVLPCQPAANMIHVRAFNFPVERCSDVVNGHAASMEGPNIKDLFIDKLTVGVTLALDCLVIKARPEKQVGWVYAWRCVTRVANELFQWVDAGSQKVRDSVGPVTDIVKAGLSISALTASASPQPASIRPALVYAAIKALALLGANRSWHGDKWDHTFRVYQNAG